MMLSAAIIAWGAVCSVWGALLISQSLAKRRGLLLQPADATEIPVPLPTVCVVVAARNEGRAIGVCLRGILGQDYPAAALSVIVVDDRSTDDTAAVVDEIASRDPRVRLMRVNTLPPGWMGKSHALWLGTREVRADWLLFTDADCALDPPAVRTAVLEARRRGASLLSLWPRNAAVGFWEHLLIPLCGGIIALWHGSLRADPAAARPFANGQFLLIEQATYEQIGGHRSVRDYLIEDVPLAEHARRAGVRSWVASGRDLVGVRMYDNLRGILDGWSRIYAGALRSELKIGLSVMWLLVGSLLPFVAAPAIVYQLATARPIPFETFVLAGLCAQHLVLLMAVSYRFWRMGGCDRRYLWLYPLSALTVIGILLRAGWWLVGRRRVAWRHTTYAIDRRGRIAWDSDAQVVAPASAPSGRRRAIAWIVWIVAGCISAAGLRHYRIANDLDDWVTEARAVGVYQSYVLVGWERAACEPSIIGERLRTLPGVALCLDPENVSLFGRLAGVTPENFVVSADGRYAGAFCFSRPGVSDDRFVEEVQASLAQDPRTAGVALAFGGPAVYHAAMERVSQRGLPQLMVAILVVGLLLLWWVTGRFRHALASVVAISLSQLVLLGVTGWLRVPVNLSISMVPPMMLCLGFSYAAHRSLRFGNVGTLSLCALTTAAGIGTFVFTALPPVRQFASFGVLGLALVWLATATLLPPPVRSRRVWIRPLLGLFIRAPRGAGRIIIGGAAILVALSGFACLPLLRFEGDPLNFFSPDTREVADFRWLDQNLTGMLPFQVRISDVGGGPTSIPDAAPLLRDAPGMRKVIDISFTVSDGGPGRTYWCLADNDALPGLQSDEPRWRRWAIGHGLKLEWRGVAAQIIGAQRIVIRTAAWSLPVMMGLAAFAAGCVATGPAGNRIRAAAVGGWVNVHPTAALVALTAATRVPLGLPSLMIGAIAIGVAVDDTLHLISAMSRRKHVVRAALECWRPCAGSSLVAASSLALFTLSPFGPTRQFGLLMAAAMLCGLVANHFMVLAFGTTEIQQRSGAHLLMPSVAPG